MFVLSKIVIYESIEEFGAHVPEMRRKGWDYNYFMHMPNGNVKVEWEDRSAWKVFVSE